MEVKVRDQSIQHTCLQITRSVRKCVTCVSGLRRVFTLTLTWQSATGDDRMQSDRHSTARAEIFIFVLCPMETFPTAAIHTHTPWDRTVSGGDNTGDKRHVEVSCQLPADTCCAVTRSSSGTALFVKKKSARVQRASGDPQTAAECAPTGYAPKRPGHWYKLRADQQLPTLHGRSALKKKKKKKSEFITCSSGMYVFFFSNIIWLLWV